MPRLLAAGHVTWDRLKAAPGDVLGGTASYAALCARRLGWEAAVLTSAGADFEPARDLPGVAVFWEPARATTRFANTYDEDGGRVQFLDARADEIDVGLVSPEWRAPDALLLGPVAGEVPAGSATAFEAGVVGAIAQGWLRSLSSTGRVEQTVWRDPAAALAGVHVLFLSEHDLPRGTLAPAAFLQWVPIVAITRGWEGLTLLTRDARHEVPSLPRQEVDPTGAGDVFAAAFLVRYHETGDPVDAAAFGACAASCVVEGVGTTAIGDRAEVEHRLVLRERLIEEGDWFE